MIRVNVSHSNLLVCVLSIEIFIRLKFIFIIYFKVAIKVIRVIPAGNISDHWKERVIPKYALRL